jgi:hypothetical protein
MNFQELDNSLKIWNKKRKRLIFSPRKKETLSLEQLKELIKSLTIKKLNILQRHLIHLIDSTLKPKRVIFLKFILKKTTLEMRAAMKALL